MSSPVFFLLPSARLLLDTAQRFLPSAPPLVFMCYMTGCKDTSPPSCSSFIFLCLCLFWWNLNQSNMTECKNPPLSCPLHWFFLLFTLPSTYGVSLSVLPLFLPFSLSFAISSMELGLYQNMTRCESPHTTHTLPPVSTYRPMFHPDKKSDTLSKLEKTPRLIPYVVVLSPFFFFLLYFIVYLFIYLLLYYYYNKILVRQVNSISKVLCLSTCFLSVRKLLQMVTFEGGWKARLHTIVS